MNSNVIDYSDDFKMMIGDTEKLRILLKGSFLYLFGFRCWEKMRYFISRSINKNGSILDIGCANGFLLRCLQEWCDYKLEPYGIDKNQKLINQAKELFPSQAKNFICENLSDLLENSLKLSKHGFPAKYDFIYWNVWDFVKFESKKEIDAIGKILDMTSDNGRLILGFYKPQHESNEENKRKIKKLEQLGFKFSGIMVNSLTDVVVWIDKN